MSMLTPCPAALPETGIGAVQYIVYGVAGLLLAGGITASVFAKSLKLKLMALALPIVASTWVITGNPQPAFATSGAPTVTSEAVIERVDNVEPQFGMLTAPVFDNPENCGTLSYQWQGGIDSTNPWTWTNEGAATTAPTEFLLPNGYCYVRLNVTLTNNSGSVTSTSEALGWCA